jgi:hypothetical protein
MTSTSLLDYSGSTIAAGLLVACSIFAIIIYVINAIFLMKLFAKANVPAWKAWIPIVNMWKILNLGGYSGAWIFINLVPGVGSVIYFIFACLAAYNIGLKLQKESFWVVIFALVSIIWAAVLGLDNSKWDDSMGRPARGPEVPPSSGGFNRMF